MPKKIIIELPDNVNRAVVLKQLEIQEKEKISIKKPEATVRLIEELLANQK